MDYATQQKIELIGVDILDRQRPLVEELKTLAKSLGIALGWHYLLDLSWIISQLDVTPGTKVVDAGAGIGLMQWYLAGKGVEVISIDRASRLDLPLRLRANYKVKGMLNSDLKPAFITLVDNFRNSSPFTEKAKGLLRDAYWVLNSGIMKKPAGSVTIYRHDLNSLDELADASVGAVVAVSSLEHNPPDELPGVVNELMRVIKPGGALLASLGAAQNQDWFHEPSKGWCYTAQTLCTKFSLPESVPINYAQYNPLFDQLINCRELKDHLADFYFHSGDNGMPWGKWEPQYQPVGVCKIKNVT
jgi:SAM-dependent methyltransferase